jgi:hypothetical protein
MEGVSSTPQRRNLNMAHISKRNRRKERETQQASTTGWNW